MKICILGAAGFIGTALSKYCMNQSHQVTMMDNNWYDDHPYGGYWTHLNNDTIDINIAREPWRLNDYFEKINPDVVYALQAYASEGRSNHIRSFIHSNNTVSMANVINACVNHKCKLVFTSSVAVYSGEPPFTETMTPRPIDEYGLSKYMSERSIQIAGDTQGLDYCIIRPRNVYGPGQNMWDRSRNLFGIWCYNALHGLPLQIYGDGGNQRSFTYIDDIIHCIYNAKDFSSEVFNLGAPYPYSIIEAASIFKSVTGYGDIVYTESRHEVKEAWCETNKSEMLGYKYSATSLHEGISRMWKWAKAQPSRPLQVPPPLEVTINAHSSLKS